ncbi:MAG: hypothetical protein ABIE07_13780 [Candidatus Zixiibacteriota bacterium]
MDNRILGILLIFSLSFSANLSLAQEEIYDHDKRFEAEYSMIGARLGTWVDQGGEVEINDPNIKADLPDAGFFTEIFYCHRFARTLMTEISMGIASRGEAVILHLGERYIGTINMYPVMVQLKFSPLSGRNRVYHPYILGGAGFVFGRHNSQIIQSQYQYYNSAFAERTETDFVGVFGGGMDFAVSEQFGLNLSAKYYSIEFKKGLAGVKDNTGISITFGFSYHLFKKSKELKNGG